MERSRQEAPNRYLKLVSGTIELLLSYCDWLDEMYRSKPSKKAWRAACAERVFGLEYSVLNRLMQIGRSEYIRDRANWPYLPQNWNALYEVTGLSHEAFEYAKTSSGLLTP